MTAPGGTSGEGSAGGVAACGYCDRPGFYDPEEDEKMPPLVAYTLGESTDLFHPVCYREMMGNEPCGGG